MIKNNKVVAIGKFIKGFFLWQLFVFMVTCLNSCNYEFEPNSRIGKERALVVYMIANNSLKLAAINLLNRIKEGDINTEKSNLLILIDVNGAPTLYKYTHTNRLETLKKFSGKNAADINCIESVLNYSLKYYPASENGIDFWSHGSAWLPAGKDPIGLRSFGYSKGEECDIILLNRILKIEAYDGKISIPHLLVVLLCIQELICTNQNN